MAEPLAPRTTLRLGGPADELVEARTDEELVEAVSEADRRGIPLLVLGGGSNVVIADEGFRGRVVDIATQGVEVESDTCGGAYVTVAAGESWDDLVARAVVEGWVGVEALSGIPGRVGATPIQNVGAYGQEVADTVARVRTWDREAAATRTFFADGCSFGYRTSRFKEQPGRFVVLSVTFQLRLGVLGAPVRYAELARVLGLDTGDRTTSADVREAVLGLRRGKGMVLDPEDHDTWSAGSFFTNPILTDGDFAAFRTRVKERLGQDAEPPAYPAGEGHTKTSAAWLIDKAGFTKGYGTGPARISTKHTLALTNRGEATTEDLLALAREVVAGVHEAFGVTLVNEPVTVGVSL
jgi:UDP-N-acetylmuramate dehydrogenase